MPRVNGNKPFKRPRLQVEGKDRNVKHFEDLSTRYDRRDYGIVNVDKHGQPCYGFTNGHYGSLVQAERIPSMVKATGGKYALPGTRRRRKGGKPNRMYHTPSVPKLLEERAALHYEILHGGGSREQFWILTRAIFNLDQAALERAKQSDLGRERSEIGRRRAKGLSIHRLLTVHANTPVRADETRPDHKPMPIRLTPAWEKYLDTLGQ